MSETKLTAEPRTTFGKGPARQLRRENKVPAVLYGHGTDPQHLALPGHATMLALKVQNALLTIDIQGDEQLALPKDVVRDPLKGFIEHVDLILVRRGEKVTVDVAVHVEGEAVPGTVVQTDSNTISLEVEATSIPENVVVSIEGAEAGTQITAGQIALPAGATLVTDPETLVVNVTEAVVEEEPEAEGDGAEGEATPEGEASADTEG